MLYYRQRTIIKAAIVLGYRWIRQDRHCVDYKFILTYFKNRTNDLLILQVDDPKGFEKLSIFLDKPIIAENFSVHNKTSNFKKL